MNPIKELSLPNYTALAILEQLNTVDTQKQINILESIILMMSNPRQIEPETIRQCVGNDDLAYYFLFVKSNEWCKLRNDEEIIVDFENELEEAA